MTELVTVSNPFDYHTFMWGDRAAMSKCFTAVMDGPQDVTMLVLDAPPSPDNDPSSWIVSADALADAAEATGRRAVIVASMAECLNEISAAILRGETAGQLTEHLGAIPPICEWHIETELCLDDIRAALGKDQSRQ